MPSPLARGLTLALALVPVACGGDETNRGRSRDAGTAAGGAAGSGGAGPGGAGGSSIGDSATWDGRPTPAPQGEPWATLSEWHLFRDGVAQAEPAEGVVPFEVISVLFADDASKQRFLFVPPGEKITYSDEGRWAFPVGTIAVKTFFYPVDARNPALGRRVIETRLLVRQADRWVGHVYLWNDEQTEATRRPTGATLAVSWTDEDGDARDQTYQVPDTNQCQQCHGQGTEMRLLGPRTRQLDRDNDFGSGPENQLDHFASLGWFDRPPPPASARVRLESPLGQGPLVERVRAYLDANCGHCHAEGGQAHSTNFHVDFESTDPVTGRPSSWGVCKFPTSAGHASGGLKYDIVPGSPDASILVRRLESTDDTVQMPPLLTQLADPVGVALVREWIAGMPARSCDEAPTPDAGTDSGPSADGGPADAAPVRDASGD